MMKNCPLCSSAAPEGAAECLSCGVIFAKLRACAEREKNGAPPTLEMTPTLAPNPWRARVAALAAVACWMFGLGIYYHIELSRSPRHAQLTALREHSSMPVRDVNGLIGEVAVHTAGSGPARREEPLSPEPEDSQPDSFDE